MAQMSQFNDIISKYKKFWNREKVEQPLFLVRNWILPPETIDNAYDDQFVLNSYLKNYDIRNSVKDDYIPMLCPEFGPAMLGHVAGGVIEYGSSSSWSKPILKDASDTELNKINFNEDRFKIVADRIDYFLKHNEHGYVVSSCDLESPFDLAVDLLGVENFLLGFYDYPDRMHKLFERCFDVWLRYQQQIHAMVPEYSGGYFDLWNVWQPKNTIWTTIDASCNVSPKIFDEFFMPVIKRILETYDWIWMHVHSVSLKMVEPLMDEPAIKGFEIADDPTCRTTTIFPRLKEIHKTKNLLLDCKKENLELYLSEFDPAGLLLFIDGVETPQEANILLDNVRIKK
jgi:hypothetical protein